MADSECSCYELSTSTHSGVSNSSPLDSSLLGGNGSKSCDIESICSGNGEGALPRSLDSFSSAFDDCDTLVSTSLVSTISSGERLTGRFEVFSGTSLGSSGTGTPSIVRLCKGVIQWSSLPRSKRSSIAFTDTDAEGLLESSTSLPLELVVTAKLRVKANKLGRNEVIGFTIYGAQPSKYGRNGSPPQLNSLIVHFTKPARTICEEWVSCINQALSGIRPTKLLFFINPRAGKGEAARIYQQHVRPYLKAVDVAGDVMLLNGPGSMKTYLRDLGEKVDSYDGVVAIGGDGTLNELINLSIFKAVEAHVMSEWTTPEPSEGGPSVYELTVEQVRSRQLYVGVVPAGSTNHIATSLFGTDNPVVATMHLLLGGRCLIDVCSLSSQKHLLAFATTAIFAAQHVEKSSKSTKRKLLRLASTHQNLKQDKDSDFITAMRYQQNADSSEITGAKSRFLEFWPGERIAVSADSSESRSVLSTQSCLDSCSVTERLNGSVRPRWSSLNGTFTYLCLFALAYRDPEHPHASSRPGLLDMVLADTLSRKEQLKNALKKKFVSQDLLSHGASIYRAHQAFINISVPGDSVQHSRNRGASFSQTLGSDMDVADGTVNSKDFDVSIGDLKKISWSSFQEVGGVLVNEKVPVRPLSTTSPFAWQVDGDPIDATSVHVCLLSKLVRFLALDFMLLPASDCHSR